MQDRSTWEALLFREYGALLNVEQIAHVLGYKSGGAVEKARQRGLLPVKTVRIPGRRGWYAGAPEVAGWIASTLSQTNRRAPP